MAKKPLQYDVEEVRSAASGRWVEILSAIAGIPRESLDGKHHPCPLCGGTDRFRLIDERAGAVLCNNCLPKNNGDGFSYVQKARGVNFPESVRLVGEYLGLKPTETPKASKPKKGKGEAAKKERKKYATLKEAAIGYYAYLASSGQKPSQETTGWMYHNVNGAEWLAVIRFQVKAGKTYCPFFFDGTFWLIGTPKGKPLPYDLPQLLKSKRAAAFEGEKCCEVAKEFNYVATTWPGGANSVSRVDASHFAHLELLELFEDNNDVGRHAMSQFAAMVRAVNPLCVIVVVQLPVGPDEDFADFVEQRRKAGKTDSDIRAEVDSLPRVPAVFGRPEVNMPGGSYSITESGRTVGKLFAATDRVFKRGGVSMRLASIAGNPLQLEPLRATPFCSEIESVAQPVKAVQVEGEWENVPTICSETTARLILESQPFLEELPPVSVLSRCPVLVEHGDILYQVSGYDRKSEVLAGGERAPEVPLPEAIELIRSVVAGFSFPTVGDRARALAAIITPALIMGGLLRARAPIDLSEADRSQSGKGYRNKLTTSIYGTWPEIISQRSRGVGSLQETFDTALLNGVSLFPTFDNVREQFNNPFLESFTTEDTYFARLPYSGSVAIDPRRFMVMMTSNKADVTVDLANRSSCVRILKQPPDYKFQSYPEGDLLAHIRANQPRFLGAVFSIVAEWHRQGKPQLEQVDHDFRPWARVLGWIVKHILKAGDMLDGHREAQHRIASPALNWLRDLALAVHRAGKTGEELRPSHILQIAIDGGVETPGVNNDTTLDDDAEWAKACRAIGSRLGRIFNADRDAENRETGVTTITIDGQAIERRKVRDGDSRQQTEYFFPPPVDRTPEHQVSPEHECPTGGQNGTHAPQGDGQVGSSDLFDKHSESAASPSTGTDPPEHAPNTAPSINTGNPEHPEHNNRTSLERSDLSTAKGVCSRATGDSSAMYQKSCASVQGFGGTTAGDTPHRCRECGGRDLKRVTTTRGRFRLDCPRCPGLGDEFEADGTPAPPPPPPKRQPATVL